MPPCLSTPPLAPRPQVRCWEVQANGTAVPKAATSHDGPVLSASWSAGTALVPRGSREAAERQPRGSRDAGYFVDTSATLPSSQLRLLNRCAEKNFLVTASWDNTIKFWDGKSAAPGATLALSSAHLSGTPYAVDVRGKLMVVATADRKIVVVNLDQPSVAFNTITSPLKYQSRCIAAFPDQRGFCLGSIAASAASRWYLGGISAISPLHLGIGSIEGRVAVHHVNKADEQKNFAFKCHRENNLDIYSVNCIAFHPTFGTFATTGSDGTSQPSGHGLAAAFTKGSLPIPVGRFSRDGAIFAYAASYDWSKVPPPLYSLLIPDCSLLTPRTTGQRARSTTTRAPTTCCCTRRRDLAEIGRDLAEI
ncbi:hypothetical protein EMIHUDRAFT_72140 [Emiliania huxleyi CCMP1516]|uniref:Uncharacterized protein n=2 Tax=Emiliania huxleyi TaxID=2903 RepID=A0A0D3K7U3_EMIH1|nr:hypothetical protein EMIHUDRAFT_72140 [Emiliania huxleyi CCMP1516]EOD31828.1 hypothetical protein EMIHUDRAFT_72140 [Emiliania huxleyi CCMP1516]|eukprot:XP_005784257.1 hypothetical protein EMIHUDRAFT_72140 [Emiliania huxleyi CCMP1516]